jgi:ADP-ribose pyrophosphatase YjhB (NUDIX family)
MPPVTVATVCVLLNEGRTLLGRHTRGPFEGFISPPGGKFEEDDTVFACAQRESLKEVGYQPIHGRDTRWAGCFYGHSKDGTWLVYIFVAANFQGKHHVTAELPARWYPCDRIPFDEMPASDVHWLSRVIAGEMFFGRFHFGETPHDLLDWAELPPQAAPPHLF